MSDRTDRANKMMALFLSIFSPQENLIGLEPALRTASDEYCGDFLYGGL